MHNLPTNWQVKSLGEVAFITAGQGAPQGSENFSVKGYPFIRAGSLEKLLDGCSYDQLEKIENKKANKHGLKLFSKGCILFAKSGMSSMKDRVIVMKSSAYVVSHLAVIQPNENLDSRYLANWLGYFKPSRLIKDESYPSISLDAVSKIKIPLPPLPIQKQIAEILDKADAAKQKRKAANKLTDEFLQSVFIEMFGDPVKNPKGWEVEELKALAKIERDTITSKNLSNDDLYVGLEHIEKETGRLVGFQRVGDIDLKSNKFAFTADHILYGKLRPYLNKVCLPNISGVCSTDIIPIRPIKNICKKYFLAYLFKQSFFVQEATSKSTGANLPRISPNILGTFKIIAPPLSLQQQFAEIVNKTEALKEKQKQSEQELENLFQSLMQKAFKGELV